MLEVFILIVLILNSMLFLGNAFAAILELRETESEDKRKEHIIFIIIFGVLTIVTTLAVAAWAYCAT